MPAAFAYNGLLRAILGAARPPPYFELGGAIAPPVPPPLLDSCVLTPLVWWHYIDNIFVLWPHRREEHLRQFIKKINPFHPTIKFTAEWSDKSVTFLDVKMIPENGR